MFSVSPSRIVLIDRSSSYKKEISLCKKRCDNEVVGRLIIRHTGLFKSGKQTQKFLSFFGQVTDFTFYLSQVQKDLFIFSTYLKNLSCLKRLEIEGVYSFHYLENVVDVMLSSKIFPTNIGFSGFFLDAADDNNSIILTYVQSHTQLESFYMKTNYVPSQQSINRIDSFKEFVSYLSNQHQNIKELGFEGLNQQSSDHLLKCIETSRVSNLKLKNSFYSWKSVCNAIKSNKNLKTLELCSKLDANGHQSSRAYVDTEFLHVVAKSQISKLIIADTIKIQKKDLINLITTCTRLTYLKMDLSYYGVEGYELLEALKQCGCISFLELNCNGAFAGGYQVFDDVSKNKDRHERYTNVAETLLMIQRRYGTPYYLIGKDMFRKIARYIFESRLSLPEEEENSKKVRVY